jgi:hypothetical protein
MIFLIEYDRTMGTVTEMRAFLDSDRSEADDARLRLELSLNQAGLSREVVLLEAVSEEALRQTHRRYFESLADLARSSATSAG